MHKVRILLCFIVFCMCLILSGCRTKDTQISLSTSNEPIIDEASNDSNSTKSSDSRSDTKSSESLMGNSEVLVPEVVCVYICGQVKNPGVYELKKDARLVDAIKAAGGLKKKAAGDQVNQAKHLIDGERIYIPSKDELAEGGLVDNAAISSDVPYSDTESMGNGSKTNGSKVNINQATAEQLMTLPGIGSSKASSIILYRETNGNFKSADGIMNIDGIKEGVYNKIKDLITID